jgi:hypothetical protein
MTEIGPAQLVRVAAGAGGVAHVHDDPSTCDEARALRADAQAVLDHPSAFDVLGVQADVAGAMRGWADRHVNRLCFDS